jgi:predicted permease
VLVAAEMALALTLSTGGALLALSAARLAAVDPGFDPSGRAAARVSAYAARYAERDDVVRVFDEILEGLRGDPQVLAAAAGSSLPLSGQASGTSVTAQGEAVPSAGRPTAGWQFVTPGYFDAAGMRLIAGRDFTAADRPRDEHVTIVSRSLARLLFGDDDPIGRRIAVGGGDADGDWHEIIGVAADVRHQALDTAPSPRVYDLFGQHWGRTLYVVVRSAASDPTSLPALMRRTVSGVDPEAPVFEPSTMQALVDRSASPRRLASAVASWLASAGVLLALIGVYAVMAASVSERTREIGVRAALGAAPRDLWRLVGGEGARTVLAGAAAGMLASAVLARVMASQLFDSRASDLAWLLPLVLAGLCLAAALAALPAVRRAASIDPLTAMRAD